MLVALGIMSISVVFVALVAGTVKDTRDSAYESIASHIASNELDLLRAGGYAALPPDGSFDDPGLAGLPQGSASTSASIWNAETKRVAAGVSWQGADGNTRFVSLTTLIASSGGL